MRTVLVFLALGLMLAGIGRAQLTAPDPAERFLMSARSASDNDLILAHAGYAAVAREAAGAYLGEDADFLASECLFRLGRLVDAGIGFATFQKEYPASSRLDDAQFYQGQVYFRQELYEKAFDVFTAILKNNERGTAAPDAAFWAAEAAGRLGDFRTALRYYAIASEMFPDGAHAGVARLSLGIIHERQADFEAAQEAYSDFLAAHPAHEFAPFANTRVAACLFQRKLYPAVLAWLDSLTDSPDPPNAAERLGIHAETLFRLGKFHEAERYYQSFLHAYPNHVLSRPIRFALGRTLIAMQKFTEAAGIFDSLATGSDSVSRAAKYQQGLALRLSGRPDMARDILQSLIQAGPSGEFSDHAHLDLGLGALDEGDDVAAAGHFEQILRNFPASRLTPFAEALLAECNVHRGDFLGAADGFDRAAAFTGRTPDLRGSSLLSAGYCRYRAGRFADAEASFRTFLFEYPDDPRHPTANLWLGECALSARNYRSALASFNQCTTADAPADTRVAALWGTVACRHALGNYAEARNILEEMRIVFHGHVDESQVAFRLGELQLVLKNYEQAAAEFQLGCDATIKPAEVVYGTLQTAYCHYLSGNTTLALNILRAFPTRHPSIASDERIAFGLGWLLFQIEDYPGAASVFQQAIATGTCGSLCWEFRSGLASCNYALTRYEEARTQFAVVTDSSADAMLAAAALDGITACNAALGHEEDAPDAWKTWFASHGASTIFSRMMLTDAERKFDAQQYDASLAEIEAWLKRDLPSPLRQEFLLLDARNLKAKGRFNEALTMLERCGSLDPNSHAALSCEMVRAEIAFDGQDRRAAIMQCTDMLNNLRFSEARAEIHLLRGRIYASNRNADSAASDFALVSQFSPNSDIDFEARIESARILGLSVDPRRAATDLLEIAHQRRDGIGARANALAVEVLFHNQNYDDAERLAARVERGLAAWPVSQRRVMLLHAKCVQERRGFSKARQLYQSVITRHPGTPEAIEAQSHLADAQ